MSTKEEIAGALKGGGAFRRKEVPIVDGVTVTVRELSPGQRDALNARLFVCGDDGKPIDDEKGNWTVKEGAHYTEEWLAATLEPAYTVSELLGDDWPSSLKARLYDEAVVVGMARLEDAAKNS